MVPNKGGSRKARLKLPPKKTPFLRLRHRAATSDLLGQGFLYRKKKERAHLRDPEKGFIRV